MVVLYRLSYKGMVNARRIYQNPAVMSTTECPYYPAFLLKVQHLAREMQAHFVPDLAGSFVLFSVDFCCERPATIKLRKLPARD